MASLSDILRDSTMREDIEDLARLVTTEADERRLVRRRKSRLAPPPQKDRVGPRGADVTPGRGLRP